MAMLSILALYNYRPEVFDGLQTPTHVDKDTLIKQLVFDLAELSLVYSDPDTVKLAIRIWSEIHIKEWQDLQETLEYEYNPIWNVDGSVTETRDLTTKRDKRGSDTLALSGTDSNQASGSDTVTASTSAYNSDPFTDRDRQETEYGRKDMTTYGRQDKTSYASGEDVADGGTITTIRQGNIGVTMTQQLIQAQREVVQFNVSDYIIKEFKRKFCVMVY